MARIGDWLRQRREELDLSQTQVHLRTNGAVAPSTLSKVEGGSRPASADLLVALAPVYRVDPTYLLKLAGILPEKTDVPEPQPVRPVETWEAIQQAFEQSGVSPEQASGLVLAIKPWVTPVLEEAKRRKPARQAQGKRRSTGSKLGA